MKKLNKHDKPAPQLVDTEICSECGNCFDIFVSDICVGRLNSRRGESYTFWRCENCESENDISQIGLEEKVGKYYEILEALEFLSNKNNDDGQENKK